MISNTLFFTLKNERLSSLWYFLAFVLIGTLAYFEKGTKAAIHIPISLTMLVIFTVVIIDLFILIAKRNKIETSWVVLSTVSVLYAAVMFFIGESKIAIYIFCLSLFVAVGLIFVDNLKQKLYK